jgi:hypothetical protein
LDDVVQGRVGGLDFDVRLVVAAGQRVGALGAEEISRAKPDAHEVKAVQ